MKISDSSIIISSYHSADQMDISIEKSSGKIFYRKGSVPSLGLEASANDSALSSEALVDRVSIFQKNDTQFQSGYRGSISSRSEVYDVDSGMSRVSQHRQAVEKIVGAVIDKDVLVKELGQRKNSSIGNKDQFLDRQWQNLDQLSWAMELSLNRTDIHYEDEQMIFESKGFVTTQDGRTIDFSLDMTMDRTFLSKTEQKTLINVWQERVNLTDPLVISLDGSIPGLSDTFFEFDLNNDGNRENIHFASNGSGFLAFDKNNDRVINNGSELFGPGTGNGFDELAAYDRDMNNWIDENDQIFSKLSIWTRDEKGVDRLISLKEAGIGAIFLGNVATGFDHTDADNTLKGRLRSSGLFLFENGNVGSVQQIDLAEKTTDLQKRPELLDQAFKMPFQPSFSVQAGTTAPGLKMIPEPEPAKSPLEQLLEQIKELKEEMEQLLQSRKSRSNSSGRTRGYFRQSDYQLQTMTQDMFLFFQQRKYQAAQRR